MADPVTQVVGRIGHMEPFDDSASDWTSYDERLTSFLHFNKVPEADKVHAFLSLIGAKTYALLKSLTAPDLPSSKSYDTLRKLLGDHLAPKPSVIGRTATSGPRVVTARAARLERCIFLQQALLGTGADEHGSKSRGDHLDGFRVLWYGRKDPFRMPSRYARQGAWPCGIVTKISFSWVQLTSPRVRRTRTPSGSSRTPLRRHLRQRPQPRRQHHQYEDIPYAIDERQIATRHLNFGVTVAPHN
ncbi:uncharacterized protein LOC125940834 isoform X1 [Dermacentor silvarum]|uniref:uncharacterized protein LOC125940834 isoform X1 n=1 Tax=Dermacentor silvarum TaxID=543639 RepID=UPI00210136F9|nr:uncharacterized protein LOC125940834 isoform X1 [Dermacentor silvarum]